MPNPAFDAALLLRGLRAMDAALGETYNVQSHTCIPSPVVYSSEFPAAGFDFTKYQGGFEGVKGVWRGWIYEDGGKGKLKSSVHEDVEATVADAFELFGKIDKDNNSKITKEEWEKAQKGRSAEDQLFDIEYLNALQNVTAKMTDLSNGIPLNPANPETYPEVIALKGENQALKDENQATTAKVTVQLAQSREETALYQKTTLGLSGVALIAMALGLRHLWKTRNAEPASTPPPASPPRAEKKEEAKPKKAPAAAAAAPAADDMDDVLKDLQDAQSASSATGELLVSEPVKGVSPEVLKAQVLSTFRHFLSQAAREALADGRELPPDAEMVTSRFVGDVNRLVDELAVAYYELNKKDSKAIDQMWKEQKAGGLRAVRQGVPQALLLKVASAYLAAEAKQAGSPLSNGFAEDAIRDAEHFSSKKDHFEGVAEIARRIGR